MEDAHCIITNSAGMADTIFAGVFDGHGGADAAAIAAQELPKAFEEVLSQPSSPGEAFIRAYSATGQFIRGKTSSGTTAATVYITEQGLYFAHVGDSRIVLVGDDKSEALTRDHKVTDPQERQRLLEKGASFWGNYLVLPSGIGLAVARALGDRDFYAFITDVPDVGARSLAQGRSHVIIACDGLWDVLSVGEAAEFAQAYVSPQEAADALVREAIRRGTGDNVTAVVLHIQKG